MGFDLSPVIQVSIAVIHVMRLGWGTEKMESTQIISGLPGQKPPSELSNIVQGGPTGPQFGNSGREARSLLSPDTPQTSTSDAL